ncbi:hypothetical protein BT96DRAFT_1012792 [Gymnopus androsaceus JB14]|uniref:DNA replication regulator Sld3 C-terminal domain-containing protein n=1 Tax=Gymnopus androsaceus JB14 TaxID=1447944 RepID=A0A6A4IIY5_9AGAR|nr:hypothetical protein BT96DRAFT_1012792 [Gymnopus androsaceus JB14]
MASISSLPISLELNPKIKWSSAHESSISRDYPFTDLAHENPDQFVARTYLQFLWLPESIMPLNLLVPSLKRVQVASTSTDSSSNPHPLHALLDPLLLTARTAANKFQVELPQILDNGGGAGEIEETMMWFVLNFEKGFDQSQNERTRSNTGGSDSSGIGSESPLWLDGKWRSRMDRENGTARSSNTILLHLLILSLPGPLPPPPQSPEMSSVKRRKRPRKKTAPIATPEDRLEAFMDKLSMWQLMGDLGTNEVATKAKDELDWIQSFCQNIVEPLFKSTLPTFCELLRSKDDEDEQRTRRSSSVSSSPPLEPPLKRSRTSTSDEVDSTTNPPTRYPSPALSSTSTTSRQELKRVPSQRATLQRERSRSLSVSLAEEAEEKQRERAKQAGVGTKKRGVLSREVSMSRVFKSKNKASSSSTAATTAPSFLVSDARRRETEVKPFKREPSIHESSTVLVEATPMKPVRTVTMSQLTETQAPLHSRTTLFQRTSSTLSSVGEEEIWDLPGSSSPDVLLLTPGGVCSVDEQGLDDSDEDGNWAVKTPTKAGKRRSSTKPLQSGG